jgi:hypothetical protein
LRDLRALGNASQSLKDEMLLVFVKERLRELRVAV